MSKPNLYTLETNKGNLAVPPLIARWEPRLGVQAERFFVQHMRTRRESCDDRACTLLLNTEFVKKSPQCLEYIVVHEMVHLLECRHKARFRDHMKLPALRATTPRRTNPPLGHVTREYLWRQDVMKIDQITSTIEQFMQSGQPDLLIVRGRWGVGKTYLWKSLLEDSSRAEKLGLKRYAYVSLFGVNTIEELKSAIFVAIRESGERKGRSGLSNLDWLKKPLKHAEQIPKLREYTGGLLGNALAFLEIQNALVCFDDLERKGKDLEMADFLGLASYLKEQRNCKIAIILNEDALEKPQLEEFRRHGEKLVDIEVTFEGSPKYAIDCVFSSEISYYQVLKEACEALQISNIRVLQRLKRVVNMVGSHLEGRCDKQVQRSVLRTTVLLVWSYYDKDPGVPPFDFVKRYQFEPFAVIVSSNRAIEPKEDERFAEGILKEYGYNSTDEVGSAIAGYLESGYLDEHLYNEGLSKRIDQAKSEEIGVRFRNAWQLYRDSFDDNEAEFVQALVSSVRDGMQRIDPTELNSTIQVLRSIGHDEIADDLIAEYFVRRGKTLSLFDIEGFEDIVQEPDSLLLQHLRQATVSIPVPLEFGDVISEATSPFIDTPRKQLLIQSLASRSISEYRRFLISLRGDSISRTIRYLLTIGSSPSSGSAEKSITENTVEALKQIGQSSRLNKVRVTRWFGIHVPDASTIDHPNSMSNATETVIIPHTIESAIQVPNEDDSST